MLTRSDILSKIEKEIKLTKSLTKIFNFISLTFYDQMLYLEQMQVMSGAPALLIISI